MGKVTEVNSDDTGLAARTAYNEAIESVEVSSKFTGDGNVGTELDLDANSITNAELAQIAEGRIKGRISTGTGNVEDLTIAQVRAMVIDGFTTTVTAAGTTTLISNSTYNQEFTGTTTQTIQMPVVSTLVLGRTFKIINNSTGILTVNSSGSDLIDTIAAGITKIFTCVKLTGIDKTSWTVNDFGASGISDTAQAWSSTIQFDDNYGSFNTNAHTQAAQIDFAVSFTSGVFGAVTNRIIVSNGDDFTFPSGYITINTDSATGTKTLGTFTPVAGKQYRVIFECVDVSNSKYNVVIVDFETTAQLNALVLSSATLDSGLDIDLVYTDTNSYPPEVQIEIEADTVNTFDSGSEFSNFAAKDSTTDKITCPDYSTLYYFRVRPVGDGVNTQTGAWSNIESAITGSASSVIVMEDDFTGTTIDTAKWDVTDPTDGVTISQNNELIFTIDKSQSVPSANTNFVETDDVITNGGCQATFAGTAVNTESVPSFALYNSFSSPLYLAQISRNSSNDAQLKIYYNDSLVYDIDSTVAFANTWKIYFDDSANNVYFYYWGGSSWIQAGTTQNYDIGNGGGNLKCRIGTNSVGGSSGTVTITVDDFYLTDDTYSTNPPT